MTNEEIDEEIAKLQALKRRTQSVTGDKQPIIINETYYYITDDYKILEIIPTDDWYFGTYCMDDSQGNDYSYDHIFKSKNKAIKEAINFCEYMVMIKKESLEEAEEELKKAKALKWL